MYFSDPTVFTKGRPFAASSENKTAAKGGGPRCTDIDKPEPFTFIKPGQTIEVLNMDGPGYVNHMWIGGNANWDSIIRIYWDDNENPSVESPIPAFFGYPYYENVRNIDGKFPTLNSALVSVMPCRGLSCFFKMPFKKHCRITVENRSNTGGIWLYYTITGELCDVPGDSLYFHASYRQSRPLKAEEAHVIIDGIEGYGNFLGVTLGMGVNAPYSCMVEGEVKMYIDDDEYPSINYTGTEDYFCGSFAFGYDSKLEKYQPFSGIYSGCHAIMGFNPDDKGYSRTSYDEQPRLMMYRWHIPDPIRFEKNFRMKILNMGLGSSGGLNTKFFGREDDMISVAYWYQNLTDKPFKRLPDPNETVLF